VEPFGAANVSVGATSQNLRLPGQEFEADTSWHHNGFRDYVQGWGRYLQSDPIGLSGGLNTFAYAFSSPLRQIDVNGLQAIARSGPRVPSSQSSYPRYTPPVQLRRILNLPLEPVTSELLYIDDFIDEFNALDEDGRELQALLCVAPILTRMRRELTAERQGGPCSLPGSPYFSESPSLTAPTRNPELSACDVVLSDPKVAERLISQYRLWRRLEGLG
jgi:RHS repeat-associated protein